MPRGSGLRQRRHTKHMPTVMLDKTSQISQRAAEPNVIIDKDIIRSRDNIAVEHGRSHQTVPAIRPGMSDFIRLYDRSGCHHGVKTFRKNFGHGIGDRIKASNLISGYTEKNRLPSR